MHIIGLLTCTYIDDSTYIDACTYIHTYIHAYIQGFTVYVTGRTHTDLQATADSTYIDACAYIHTWTYMHTNIQGFTV